jgi:hypothetical protein
MALLSPTLEVIKRQKVQPTEGEWALLNFLLENLDETYEIYFQPFLNGDNPDFAIMRKESGVLLIEVKDWNLQHYYVDEKTKWRLIKDDTFIKSPLNQVESYKENLFKLHMEELFLKNVKNKNHWATVNCAVYFHNATEQELTNFLLSNFQTETKEKNYSYYRKFVSYFGLLGNNSLNKNRLEALFSKFWLNKRSNYFDETLYNSFCRYLKAPFHQIEEGIKINYTKEQQELIRSEVRPRRKIKGVAGSGKTLVLAKRAVNAHIRTGSKVLILTYNLSLKNYIHDRISDVRENFYWNNFYITNYHNFFKTQANNYNLEIHSLNAWQDTTFFEGVKNQIRKFDVVLIDEIQDYQQEWLDIIATYFMHDDTEWIVFGDDKQDIYQRKLVVRNIPGAWNKSLDNSFRFTGAIANIAIKFQKKYFDEIYELDDIKTMSQLDFETRTIEYHFFNSFTTEKLFEAVYSVLEKNRIHSSDAGILCSKVEILRAIDFLIRNVKNENTATTFESQEEFDTIKNDEAKKLIDNGVAEPEVKYKINKVMHDRLEDIRKIKKNHFWMKTGTVKLSTVHSFKGWEIDTLFLFIENEDDGFTNAELIYTGLTRARKNLIVFNLGNKKYDNFFRAEIDQQYLIQ